MWRSVQAILRPWNRKANNVPIPKATTLCLTVKAMSDIAMAIMKLLICAFDALP